MSLRTLGFVLILYGILLSPAIMTKLHEVVQFLWKMLGL